MDYHQLINVWPSVQSVSLRGRILRKGPDQPCSLRLREFRWNGDEEPTLEFLEWLLTPSLGTLVAIRIFSMNWRDIGVQAIIQAHAPYLRSIHVPYWLDVIAECHALEELCILWEPFPVLNQIPTLARLRIGGIFT